VNQDWAYAYVLGPTIFRGPVDSGIDASPLPNEAFQYSLRAVMAPVRVEGAALQAWDDDNFVALVTAELASRKPAGERCTDFAGAWLAVPTRLRSMETYMLEWEREQPRIGVDPLFGYFTNAVALMESLGYAMYCAASLIAPTAFPYESKRDRAAIDLASTTRRFRESYARHSVSKSLDRLGADDVVAHVRVMRNVLSHRITPMMYWHDDEPTYHWATTAHPDLGFVLDHEGVRTTHEHMVALASEAIESFRAWIADHWLPVAMGTGLWPASLSTAHLNQP
jgi:hypothetical protein